MEREASVQEEKATLTESFGSTVQAGDCYGLDGVPQNSYVEVLIPSTSEFDRIWALSHYRSNLL